jgi:hypothetical protein
MVLRKMLFRGFAGVVLAMLAFACLAQSTTLTVDSRRTYLRTSSDGGALNAAPVDLFALGFAAGDTIRLTQLGDFNCHPNCGDNSTGMIALFSSVNATLASSSVVQRVTGAIDAGVDAVTAATFFGNLPTDIPQDFAVPATGVNVIVPAGARFLYVTAHDSLYGDNGDPNGDFAVRIELAPVSNAGPDQTVDENAAVTLDGSASAGRNLTFHWEQLAGDAVVLSDPASAQPSFTAPNLSLGMKVLTFQLIVTAGSQTSTDTVDITVTNVNRAPSASADVDQTVAEGSPVMLDGSASFDPDNDSIAHQWMQIGGPPVELTGANTAKPTFTAPLLPRGTIGSETLTFVLTVSDGVLEGMDMVEVLVEQVNHAPVANAGTDQTKNEGALVMLNGQASSDPDLDPITSYAWTQVSGPLVTLSDATSASPFFTAPVTGGGGATLEFALAVSDGFLASEVADLVSVNVVNVNDPPLCAAARPSVARLWPPSHKMIEIAIAGVADPDNDQVMITITGVTQDEPLNGLGDGDTSPDAVIRGDNVLLRAERSGNGNGRVYQVSFTATDLHATGGSCSGTVAVVVPQSSNSGASPIDDGQYYDATSP